MRFIPVAAFLFFVLTEVSSRSCINEDECAENECCVFFKTKDLTRRGSCVRLGRLGKRCNEPQAKLDYYGGKFANYCPCQDGLICAPKGLSLNVTDPLKISKSLRCQEVQTPAPEVITDEVVEEKEEPPQF